MQHAQAQLVKADGCIILIEVLSIMGDRNIERHSEKAGLPQELTFNHVMDIIANEQSSRSSHANIKETRHGVPAPEFIDFSESTTPNAKYDAATNSYQTDDGYILPLGAPKIERLSGYVLENQLNELAASEEHKGTDYKDQKNSNDSRPATNRVIVNSDSLVALPGSELNYGTMAKGLNGRSLYAPPSTSCSETSVSADFHILGISGGGLTIYDEQNDDCRLAQTVAQSCAIAELLSLEVQNAHTAQELMKRSDAVVTATDYCAETIDAVKKEQQQIKEEDEQSEDE